MSSGVAILHPKVVRQTIPWEDKPHGVVSLLDMMRFYGDLFVQTLTRILQWEVKCARIVNNPATQLAPTIAVEIYAYVGTLFPEMVVYGFKGASLKAARIHKQLEESHMQISYGQMSSLLRELRERIEDDFHTVVFVSLSAEESVWYDKPVEGWEEVIRRFHKVRHDVDECSKCFGLARYGAAIFHVLLIAEYGVIKVAELFGVAGDRPGWGALERLQRINDKKHADKSPLERQHADFLKNVLPLAFSMKDSWRHKISHVDNKLEWMDTDFSSEVAKEIVSATRGFMRRLATDLPE
jgi:hypothetical protein